ncbi:hypothetical protein D3C76_1566360 [compost metagenome]
MQTLAVFRAAIDASFITQQQLHLEVEGLAVEMAYGQIISARLKVDRRHGCAHVKLQLWIRMGQIRHAAGKPSVRERGWQAQMHVEFAPALHRNIGVFKLLKRWLDLRPIAQCLFGRL